MRIAMAPDAGGRLATDDGREGRMQDPILFTLAVLAILGTPGPTNTLLATSGAAVGLRRSLPLLPAETAGYLISILTIGLVVGPLLAGTPVLVSVLRVGVGCYLLLLAVRLWQRGDRGAERTAVIGPAEVFLTTLLNPKGVVLSLAVVPFGRGVPLWPYLLGIVLLLVSVATCWVAAGAVAGRAAQGAGVHRLVPRIGAAVIGVFGVVLVTTPLIG
jgi:threonine/homoserine/homoserine lactone efflux protein